MLKNYLLVALRSIRKQQGLSVINISGLGCGIALCLLIILFNRDEISFDQFHTDHEQIHRVERFYYAADQTRTGNSINDNLLLPAALKEDIPEVEYATLLFDETSFLQIDRNVTPEATEESILFTGEDFLKVFSFPLMHGNRSTALDNPNSVVLTASTAKKHFGDQNPIGEAVQLLIMGEFRDFVVSGVAADLPSNSSVVFDVIARYERYVNLHVELADLKDSWSLNMAHSYVYLRDGVVTENLTAKLDAFTERYRGEEVNARRADMGYAENEMPVRYIFRPIAQVHFMSSARPLQTYLLPGLGLLILTMACINFTMLAIGKSAWRAREVGIRKVVGAKKLQLMIQFWSEALVMSTLAALVGLFLAWLFLPAFNALTEKSLSLGTAGSLIFILGGLVLLCGVLAGSYPALLLSSVWPVKALSGRFKLGSKSKFMQTLVVVQFTVTAFLLIGALVLSRQIQFLAEKDLGFNHTRIVNIPMGQLDGQQIAERLRFELRGDRAVEDITATGNNFGYRGHTGTGFRLDDGTMYAINQFPVESNHLDFFDLNLVAGRTFDPARSSDTTNAILVNQALVEAFELTDPIGKQIPYVEEHEIEGVIVGIVEDYNYQALYQEISPAMLTLERIWTFDQVYVQLGPDIQQGLTSLRTAWNAAVPGVPFIYEFLDEQMAAVYAKEQKLMQVTRYAAFFAIIIACLGLLGLTALSISGRIKEIGIRKVLGASAGSIVSLVSKEFGYLVGIGFLLATPAALFFVKDVLSRYAYRISLDPLFFLQGAFLLGMLAFMTISILAYNAAQRDPVDSLRYE